MLTKEELEKLIQELGYLHCCYADEDNSEDAIKVSDLQRRIQEHIDEAFPE